MKPATPATLVAARRIVRFLNDVYQPSFRACRCAVRGPATRLLGAVMKSLHCEHAGNRSVEASTRA